MLPHTVIQSRFTTDACHLLRLQHLTKVITNAYLTDIHVHRITQHKCTLHNTVYTHYRTYFLNYVYTACTQMTVRNNRPYPTHSIRHVMYTQLYKNSNKCIIETKLN